LVVTGPRQSGKTTLLRRLFLPRANYVSLELPDVAAAARADPRAFLATYPPPVVLDEIQYAPDLLPYVKERIDDERSATGQFFLTGSQNLALLDKVTESLAGRAATLHLLPLSLAERRGTPDAPLPWERQPRRTASPVRAFDPLWSDLVRGSYPEIATDPSRDATLWHANYVRTYLERDVRSLRQVGDLSQFQSFLRAIAARSGGLLNASELGRDLGIASNSVKAWLSVLEATFQIVLLRPYHANIQKRLVKSPKIYFTDVGTLCYLVGLKSPAHAAAGPMGGAIFETAVLSEIWKTIVHRGEEPRMFFWRPHAGIEVDFLVETARGLVPIEAKLSATPRPEMARGIADLRRDLGPRVAGEGYVVHPGDTRLPLGDGTTALPFCDL
jgi:predicted AAA+ superfamily ATPase